VNAGPHLFLLQMAGRPGSGKSSLARVVGRATSAVVLDEDVLKTALLNAGDTRARRLGGRSRLRSQPYDPAVALEQTTVAPGGPFLRVDTTQPIDRCLQLVLEYLQ
jgi:hypothetical protein